MNRPPAPAEIAYLTKHIGEAAALTLIEKRGGTRLYVPAEPNQASALALEIGLPAAQALAREFGGETLKIPLCKFWRMRVYKAEGCSYAVIARRLGTTETTIQRQLSARTNLQPDLPGL
jgi:hypothetical protein